MKTNISILIMMLICINIYSQNVVDEETSALVDAEKYKELVDKFGKTDGNYSYQTLYNIALAYYMLSDDGNTLMFADLAIEKDPTQARPYFFKGSTLNYMDKIEEAIPYLKKSISLGTDSLGIAQAYGNLGYSYYKLNELDSAMIAYQKAKELDTTNPQFYAIIAEIYNSNKDLTKSLEYYYLAKQNSSILDDSYTSLLFNIGLLEQYLGNTQKSEASYKELLQINPADYHTYAKLIQIYNKTKEYDKIPPLKAVLYDAHKKQLIQDKDLSDMFCIDQFEVDSTQIKVFERYESGVKDKIYDKILFFVLDDNEKVNYTIQTEYSPTIKEQIIYILCASKDDAHINYAIGFDDNSSYEEIKSTVIGILEKQKLSYLEE